MRAELVSCAATSLDACSGAVLVDDLSPKVLPRSSALWPSCAAAHRILCSISDLRCRMGQISQTISDTNDMIFDGYMHRQAIDERIAEKRSDATLGVHSVESPAGDVCRVPNGYDHYWTNGLGDF